ncbi:unnamed protein product [Sphenostylis stenocarpa]|uniref:Uncharacterized protein n=1 Tax=Sphenostylis stenocarpa TaxID=92480 RepID=A0AA86W618_9FABA|nr:unnamed protein product [Sphenostylis stenocarpa]
MHHLSHSHNLHRVLCCILRSLSLPPSWPHVLYCVLIAPSYPLMPSHSLYRILHYVILPFGITSILSMRPRSSPYLTLYHSPLVMSLSIIILYTTIVLSFVMVSSSYML